VFSATHAGELRVWPGGSARAETSARKIWNSRGAATRLVFSADSKILAVPGDGEAVDLLDVPTLERVARVPGLRYPVWMGASELIGVAADGAGAIRAKRDGSGATRELEPAEDILQLWAGADGAAVCASDNLGRLWWREAAAAMPRKVAEAGFEGRFAQAADAKLGRLWHAGRDNQLRCLELATARDLWVATLPALAPGLALSPDEKLIAAPMENGRVQVHDAATGALRRTLDAGGSTPQHALFSPDGARLFVVGSKGDITCHETAGWLQLGLFQLPTAEALHHAQMSPDGSVLAAVTKTGVLHLLRARMEK
jgi:DNA-binding beta-propeller fold protein YncE